jgi:hypothetical protein
MQLVVELIMHRSTLGPTVTRLMPLFRRLFVTCSGGGGCASACDVGKMCSTRWDCKTGNCTNSTCQQLLTCSNRVLDSTEGDVDCGQLCARQCGVMSTCRLHGDCISGVCTSGKCVSAPTCTNGRQDGMETGVVVYFPWLLQFRLAAEPLLQTMSVQP